ncbi:MAG: hypothetical protein Q7Q73_03430 [Verrucomicrobiota bacterium JB024]|jgi:uncharacterized BrkB/YihY/UPF0761 family membrane protein|nr:hypothetical protein [Verrucomicrobiota bacterium JB024]
MLGILLVFILVQLDNKNVPPFKAAVIFTVLKTALVAVTLFAFKPDLPLSAKIIAVLLTSTVCLGLSWLFAWLLARFPGKRWPIAACIPIGLVLAFF